VGLAGRVWKISPSPDFKPWTNQPEASRYTDYAILATRALEIEAKKMHINKYSTAYNGFMLH